MKEFNLTSGYRPAELILRQAQDDRLFLVALLSIKVHQWQNWLTWDGNRWRRDRDGSIMRCVKEFCLLEFHRALTDHPNDPKAATDARREAAEMGDKAQAERMLKMAESDPRVIVHPETLDADPWLLGTGNGVCLRPVLACSEVAQLAYDSSCDCMEVKPKNTVFLPDSRARACAAKHAMNEHKSGGKFSNPF